MIETLRVSERARYQLMTIRKRTGIENWNVICRWALVVSLKDQSIPPHENIVTDSSVEMTWRTFGGTYEKTYLSLLIQRLIKDKIDITKENVNNFFKIHLHRGLSNLATGKFKKINDYLKIKN